MTTQRVTRTKVASWGVRPIFAWYDLWVGAYWDGKFNRLYVLPLPCVGVVIQFPLYLLEVSAL